MQCEICAGIDPDCANCELLTQPNQEQLMTIEHKTTHGPHGAGQLAADWMLETGKGTGDGWARVPDTIRMAVPHQDMALTLESAAALRDALTAHLENMDSPTEALSNEPARTAGAIALEIFNPWTPPPAPADVVEVAEHIRDAYADNSRTLGAPDVGGMTDAEAFGVGELRTGSHGCLVDGHGILYTDSAALELRVKANRHRSTLEPRVPTDAQLERLSEDVLSGDPQSPVTDSPMADVTSGTVRAWTDDQCRGAWNHAMEAGGTSERLTDRPTGRKYTVLGSRLLRRRLNQINGADADRG